MRWSTQASASIGASLAWSTRRAVSPGRSGGEVLRSAGASPFGAVGARLGRFAQRRRDQRVEFVEFAHGGGKVEGRGG